MTADVIILPVTRIEGRPDAGGRRGRRRKPDVVLDIKGRQRLRQAVEKRNADEPFIQAAPPVAVCINDIVVARGDRHPAPAMTVMEIEGDAVFCAWPERDDAGDVDIRAGKFKRSDLIVILARGRVET